MDGAGVGARWTRWSVETVIGVSECGRTHCMHTESRERDDVPSHVDVYDDRV